MFDVRLIRNIEVRFSYTFIGGFKGEGRGRGDGPPPEAERIVVEKGVISEGSIFSNKFSKHNFKMPFSIEFSR